MLDKKNIIITVILFITFFLSFPLKLNSNLKYSPQGAIPLDKSKLEETDNLTPYLFNRKAGYFTKDLKKAWSFNIKDGVTLLDDSYINFSKDAGSFKVMSIKGELKYVVEDNGYPFSVDNRLFIISRDRKRLSEVKDGKIVWSKPFNSIITSIDANSSDVVIGFDKGNFVVLDSNGNSYFKYQPGGSRKKIIYSVKISKNSGYIGVVSGLDPQRFILYEKKDRDFKPIHVFNLRDEVKFSLKLFIAENNQKIFIEGLDGFYIVENYSKEVDYIEDNYRLKNVESIEDLGLYMVHTAVKNYNRIRILTKDNRVLLDRGFISDGVSVKVEESSIYVVLDDSIVKLDILEEL